MFDFLKKTFKNAYDSMCFLSPVLWGASSMYILDRGLRQIVDCSIYHPHFREFWASFLTKTADSQFYFTNSSTVPWLDQAYDDGIVFGIEHQNCMGMPLHSDTNYDLQSPYEPALSEIGILSIESIMLISWINTASFFYRYIYLKLSHNQKVSANVARDIEEGIRHIRQLERLGLSNNVAEALNCPVTKDLLGELPKLLSCGHTFSSDVVQHILKEKNIGLKCCPLRCPGEVQEGNVIVDQVMHYMMLKLEQKGISFNSSADLDDLIPMAREIRRMEMYYRYNRRFNEIAFTVLGMGILCFRNFFAKKPRFRIDSELSGQLLDDIVCDIDWSKLCDTLATENVFHGMTCRNGLSDYFSEVACHFATYHDNEFSGEVSVLKAFFEAYIPRLGLPESSALMDFASAMVPYFVRTLSEPTLFDVKKLSPPVKSVFLSFSSSVTLTGKKEQDKLESVEQQHDFIQDEINKATKNEKSVWRDPTTNVNFFQSFSEEKNKKKRIYTCLGGRAHFFDEGQTTLEVFSHRMGNTCAAKGLPYHNDDAEKNASPSNTVGFFRRNFALEGFVFKAVEENKKSASVMLDG